MTAPKEGFTSGVTRIVAGSVDSSGVWTEGSNHLAILHDSGSLSYVLPDNSGRSIGSILDTAYVDTEDAIRLPAIFTASISVQTLTVTAITSGTIYVGQTVQWAASSANEPVITAQLTGTTGGTGTYSIDETNAAGSTTMNTDGVIVVPSWANYVSVIGHIEYPAQATGDGFASVHLFRNADATPPQGDAAFHARIGYSASNASYTSISAPTGKIPVLIENEAWSLRGWQSSGGTRTIGGGSGGQNWLSVEFFV